MQKTMSRNWYEFKAKAGAKETEILLYDEIGGFGVSASSFIAELQSVPQDHRLVLRIHSPGGSVLDGNAIANAIKAHPGGVTTQVDGLAASMASVLAIAGSPSRMAGNALMMIHNVSGGVYGDSEEMRRTADLLDKVQETVVEAYSSKSKKSKKMIRDMMDAETWFSAQEAKDMGFVDEITDDVKMAARFDMSKFRNAPIIDTKPHSNTMTIETPEFLALQAEHKQTCELSLKLKTDLEAKTAEASTISAKLTDVTAKLEAADKSITELKASLDKQAEDHKTALADFDKKVATAAEAKLAALGTKPVTMSINSPQTALASKALVEQLEAIKDPTERIRFYRTNKEAIDAAFRQ